MLSALVLGGTTSGAPPQPVPVAATAAHEYRPRAWGEWIAWSEIDLTQPPPRSGHVYLQRTGRDRVELDGRPVGFTGASVALQRSTGVVWRDLDTGAETPIELPETIRRSLDFVSRDWVGYTQIGRCAFNRIALFHRLTGRDVELARHACGDGFAGLSGLNDRYAVWTECVAREPCEVWRYDLRSGVKIQVPNPRRFRQFAGAVTPAGDVYFARAEDIQGCSQVRLLRYRLGRGNELIRWLGRGSWIIGTAVASGPEGDTLYYARTTACDDAEGDVYKIRVPR